MPDTGPAVHVSPGPHDHPVREILFLAGFEKLGSQSSEKWFNREIGELGFEPWGWLIPESVFPNLSPSWNRVRLGRSRRCAGDTLKSTHMGFCRPRVREDLRCCSWTPGLFRTAQPCQGVVSFQQSGAERLAVCLPCPCKIHGILHDGLSHPKAPALGLCGQSTGPREAEELMQTVPF